MRSNLSQELGQRTWDRREQGATGRKIVKIRLVGVEVWEYRKGDEGG